MCPDQLFAALSAWYMCAISFNRWYSIYRPTSFFFHASSHASVTASKSGTRSVNEINRRKKNDGSPVTPLAPLTFSSSSSSSPSFCFSLSCFLCFTRNIKYRRNLQSFRGITIITVLGILCCLYPIFMHELRPIKPTSQHFLDTEEKTNHTDAAAIWKRCSYSKQHEQSYDIIGIILSCVLHILPLTFVALMNIMIIIKLRKRQNMMALSINSRQCASSANKILLQYSQKDMPILKDSLCTKTGKFLNAPTDEITTHQSLPIETHKDQFTLTDLTSCIVKSKDVQSVAKLKSAVQRKHHSRDRTVTLMLVSVALSYLILTIPYRLFWSYNVYMKRMHPEKLNSSNYLLKMHYIDHVLRTIRNIHYGTNFIFFILLSKSFRRKFQQLFIENIWPKSKQSLSKSMDSFTNNNHNSSPMNNSPSKSANIKGNLEESQQNLGKNRNKLSTTEHSTKHIFHKSLIVINDKSSEQNRQYSVIKLDHSEIAPES